MWRYGSCLGSGLVAVLIFCSGCGMPHDPDGTYDRVRGGRLRVGFTENPPWTLADEQQGGIEVNRVKDFAEELDAEIRWFKGSETQLIEALHRGELDLVVGGFVESSPWADRVGFTQPYITVRDERHVMAVAPGENRWLLELERFLQAHKGSVRVEALRP